MNARGKGKVTPAFHRLTSTYTMMTKQDNTRDRHQTSAFWRTTGGWTCLIIGVLGLALPIIPGIPLLVVGLVALSPNYPWARSGLGWMKERIRKVTLRKKNERPGTAAIHPLAHASTTNR
jgi:hypothetical protein